MSDPMNRCGCCITETRTIRAKAERIGRVARGPQLSTFNFQPATRASRPAQRVGADEEIARAERRRTLQQEHRPQPCPWQRKPRSAQLAILSPRPLRCRELLL